MLPPRGNVTKCREVHFVRQKQTGTQKAPFITKHKNLVLQEVLQKDFSLFILKGGYDLHTTFVVNALGHTETQPSQERIMKVFFVKCR